MNTLQFVKVLNEAANQVETLSTVMNIPSSSFRIGGSIALRALIPSFHDRNIHDIDIIINAPKSCDIKRIIAQIAAMNTLINGSGEEISCDKYSFSLGTIRIDGTRYTRNIIIDTCPQRAFDLTAFKWGHTGCIYIQDPRRIRAAKQSYRPIRQKDLKDIAKILSWEVEADMLPF